MFDIGKIASTVLPLVGLIIAFVQMLKDRFGVSGGWLTGVGFGMGFILGGLVGYALVLPITILAWIEIFAFGMILGLMATGLYDTGVTIGLKIVKALSADTPPAPPAANIQ